MKILHVVPTYIPAWRYGGPIHSVHGLCKALAGQGHDVHVFTSNVDGPGDTDVPLNSAVDLDGVKVWYFPSTTLRRLYFSPMMYQELNKRIAGFDVVHLHSVFLWPTLAAARAARKAGVPYLLAPRGMLVKELIRRKSRLLKSLWLALFERRTIENAASIHVTSQNEEEELKRFNYRLPGCCLVPNGVDSPRAFSENEVADDVRQLSGVQPYVLYFGRINWKKGLDRLIRSWRDVPGAKLVIAGNDEEGYAGELKQIAVSAGVTSRTSFLVRSISGADKEALLANAELFVLPSYSENFGITVLEAMVRGVPVIVTPEVGAAGIVDQAGGGRVVNADDLADEISTLLADEESMATMGKRGKKWAEQKYTWEAVGMEMQRCYRDIVSSK